MNLEDENELDAFLHRDGLLPQLSVEAVAKSLDDFPLQLRNGRDMDWLAMATRRALGISLGNVEDGPKRTSNLKIRDELERLARITQSTWLELFECNQATENRLFEYSWRHSNLFDSADADDGVGYSEPASYARFKAAVKELDWLAAFLATAARETEGQRGPWRQAEEKQARIIRAQYLAPIFEAAFGQPVSANNWPTGAQHKSPTPFMDYYQRMVEIAFDERATPNLSAVLKIACNRHRKHPAQFGDGVIPGL